MEPNRESQELVSTRSYHTDMEDSVEEEDMVYIHEEDVPSHWRLLLREVTSCSNKGMRRIKSKAAILVLVITCMVNISFNGALGDILGRFLNDMLHIDDAGILISLGIIFVRSIPQLAYPVAGWVADAHFGRYKVILASFWLMLVGYAMIFITHLIKYFYNPEAMKYIVYFGIFPAAFLAINTGLAAFQANVIPFGLDQMPDASTEELSAFIHWYYGLRNILAGTIPLAACFLSRGFDFTTVVMSSVEVACVAFALILCHGFKRVLIIEPKSLNPFKLLHGVLQFALKNKVPLCRSAFTYWEDAIPSRLDLAKSKYGGPFSHEQVEDIKTFLRATGFIVVVSVFMIGYYTLLLLGILFSHKLDEEDPITPGCKTGLFYQIVLDTYPIFLMIVAFETVIYPCFKTIIPSMQKRIGLGMLVGLIGLLVLFILDVYGYNRLLNEGGMMANFTTSNVSHVQLNCYLVNDSSEGNLVNISVHAVSAVMLLGAIAETFLFIAALEFIVAQSPYGMRGMLIGAFYCVRGLYGFVTAFLFLFFTLGFKSHPLDLPSGDTISCGMPLIVTVIVISAAGLGLYVVVSKKYQPRVRDENFNPRTFAEKYYYGSTSAPTRSVSVSTVIK